MLACSYLLAPAEDFGKTVDVIIIFQVTSLSFLAAGFCDGFSRIIVSNTPITYLSVKVPCKVTPLPESHGLSSRLVFGYNLLRKRSFYNYILVRIGRTNDQSTHGDSKD